MGALANRTIDRSTSMNESARTQLKIIVERAVRPIRASASRKCKIREELLAHVCGVFEEESANLGDDRTALERTALRFGNATEVTDQLQESVSAADGFMRLLEGRPGESMLRGALRFAWIEGAIVWVALGTALFAAGWKSAWSREELITVVSSFGFLPLWLVGPLWLVCTAFAALWMEKSLHGPERLSGWPRIGLVKLLISAWAALPVRFALLVGGLCLLASVCIGGPQWPTRLADWNHLPGLAAFLLVGFMAASSVVCAWVLIQTVGERRRRQEEWSRLPIESQSYR
jgi:hypothetical protein